MSVIRFQIFIVRIANIILHIPISYHMSPVYHPLRYDICMLRHNSFDNEQNKYSFISAVVVYIFCLSLSVDKTDFDSVENNVTQISTCGFSRPLRLDSPSLSGKALYRRCTIRTDVIRLAEQVNRHGQNTCCFHSTLQNELNTLSTDHH